MADIFLNAGESLTFSPFANSRYFGNTGNETVGLTAAAVGATISQNVETVQLAGSVNSYTYQQSGNQLLVFSGATRVATITVQNDADGTALQFANGGTKVTVSAAGMVLGGATVPSAAPGVVNPTDPLTPGTGATTLTRDADTVSGSTINAPRTDNRGGTDQMNSLNDDDVITGLGTDATLNFDYVNDSETGDYDIVPTLNNIKNLNVKFTTDGGAVAGIGNVASLDLQDADATLDVINISRIDSDLAIASINNLVDGVSKISVTDSNAPSAQVEVLFTAAGAAAPSQSTAVELSNVQIANLRIESDADGNAGGAAVAGSGIETITLTSSKSTNVVGTLTAEDLEVLNINGSKDLTLGLTTNTARAAGSSIVEASRYGAGLANVAGSLTKIDATNLEGNLTLHLGAELNSGLDGTSGLQVQLEVLGGKGNDTFVLTDGSVVGGAVGNTDKISGGAGNNKLVIVGSATVGAATTPNVTSVQAVEIRSGHDDLAGLGVETPDVVNLNANAFDALATTFIRNEGQEFDATAGVNQWVSVAEGLTVNLTNYSDAQASAITLAHGTTGNSDIANNIVNLTYKTNSAANAAKVTLVDGINNNPVFNAQLNLTNAELVTIIDTDTESNTIHLGDTARAQAGSTLTATNGQVGNYLNFDSFTGTSVAAGGTAGYGYATNGTAGNSTSVAAAVAPIAGVPVTVSTSARDNAVASVFNGTAGTLLDGATRHTFENVDASTFVGDVIIRLGDVTRADGVTSQNIKTGTGNDTIIFDAIGVTNAGFTSGDTIAAGKGTDTLVLDGNTATIPGTPRVNHQTSEWDNVTGIDVLRYGNNAGVANGGGQVANAGGAYYTKIDNDFVSQTDAGNRLTIVNNDGRLDTNTESDLVLDLRGLSQSKWVSFVGANGIGTAGISSNRVVVDDISANQNMILDGGDTDVRATATPGYVAGNNNVYEVSNTANASVADLSQTKNFGLINFTNDAATNQTLTLTLNNTIVEALVDASNTAANAATQEVLFVSATDNGGIASVLNIDARAVDGFRALNVTGSIAGNDVLTLNSNVGGTAHAGALGASTGDRVNWVGGAATQTYAITAATGTSAFQVGTTVTTHVITGVEIYDLSGLTYASGTFTGGVGQQTVVAGAGVDTFAFAAGDTGITAATADIITGFASASDVIDYSAALTIVTNVVVPPAGTAAINASGLATFNAADNTTALRLVAAEAGINAGGVAAAGQVVLFQGAGADAANAYVFISDGVDGIAATDVLIQLTNVNTATAAFDQLVLAGGNATIA